MPRIRTIKPEFWTDGNMVTLTPWARLFYIGTWNFAFCDQGHLPDDAMALKLRILPADPVDAHALVDELVSSGRIVRRRLLDGRSYLLILRFAEHQKLDARWSPRCPYCAAEPKGFVEVTAEPTEPPVNSSEYARTTPQPERTQVSHGEDDKPAGQHTLDIDRPETPPELAEPRPTTKKEGVGRGRTGQERTGKDLQRATRAAAPHSDAAGATVTQRSKVITDAYTAVVPMCKWPAVNAIVIRAIKAERWADDEVQAAVLRLADEGRPVTVDTLRIELDGLPPSNGARASPRPSTADSRVAQALAAGIEVAQLERREIE